MDAAAIMDIELGETMPIFCDKCGAKIRNENAKFCDKCGNEITTTSNNIHSTSTSYSCPYCGQEIPYSTKCPKCGKSLQNDDAVKAGLGVVGIIILLFLISGICGFLLLLFA